MPKIILRQTSPIPCANATYSIEDTLGNVLYAGSIASGGNLTQPITNSTVANSNASYSVNVLAEGSLTLPDQQINVNSVDEGDIPSVGTIDIDLSDGVNPVVPTSVTITGRTIDIVVPSGGSPSGVLFKRVPASQYTSYRTGDEGNRAQIGWFDYTPPSTPKAIADLDYTTANFNFVLDSPLVVNGVSSTVRFVDILGGQTWSGVGNSNNITIDKLTGLMYTRQQSAQTNWNTHIDNALAFSITFGANTYSDWYLMSMNEMQVIFARQNQIAPFTDPISAVQPLVIGGFIFTSTTIRTTTTSALELSSSGETYGARAKTDNLRYGIYVHKADSLITAP